MAKRVANATGVWSNGAIWDKVVNSPSVSATAVVQITGTVYTDTFSAPNLVNACTGVEFLTVNAIGTAGTITVTLQEDLGAWADTLATADFLVTNLKTNSWIGFRFAVPHVFTTLTANKYRFKIVMAGGVGTTNFQKDNVGIGAAFRALDNETGALANTDDVHVVGFNGTTSVTVTVDNSGYLVGSGLGVGATVSEITENLALVAGLGGELTFDNSLNTSLTVLGHIVCAGGIIRLDNSATAFTAQLLQNQNGTSANYGIRYVTNAVSGMILQGAPKTFIKTTYVSGLGTVASPLELADTTGWAVNDEIWIAPTTDSGYNQGETRFIIGIVSPTTFTVSSTLGGAETALVYTHTTDAIIVNKTMNVIVGTTSSTVGLYIQNDQNAVGNVDWDWCRFNNVGSTNSARQGIYALRRSDSRAEINNVIVNNVVGAAGLAASSGSYDATWTNIYSGFNPANSSGGSALPSNLTKFLNLTDCYALDFGYHGFNILADSGRTFTRCVAIGCGQYTSTSSNGWVIGTGAATINFVDCEAQNNRYVGIRISNCTNAIATNWQSGTKGKNSSASCVAGLDSTVDFTFIGGNFDETTLMLSNTGLLEGSKIKFHDNNDVSFAHYWYTNTGSAQATGAGLADTQVRTAGTHNVRLNPEDVTTGFKYQEKVLAEVGKAIQVYGWLYMNAAFAGDAAASLTVNLYRPNSLTPDSTQTITKTAAVWQVFNLAVSYAGTVNDYAIVEIVAKSTTASAYIYVADFFDGTNELTNLNTWSRGEPAEFLYPQLGDPAAVWTILTSTLTTPGTTGYTLANLSAGVAGSVWDALTVDHIVNGSFGKKVGSLPLATDNAAAVWNSDRATFVTPGTFGEYVNADVVAISGDATSADNLELQYDGTGLTGDTYPARQDQANDIEDKIDIIDTNVDDIETAIGVLPSNSSIADAVWDEVRSGHTGTTTFGYRVDSNVITLGASTTAATNLRYQFDGVTGLTGSRYPIRQDQIVSAATISDTVWDEATSGHVIVGSTGAALLAANNGTPPTAASIADAVWDELTADHLIPNSFGADVALVGDLPSEPPTAQAISDTVWDEAIADHLSVGSTGKALNDANSSVTPADIADAVWDEAYAGHTVDGTYGKDVALVSDLPTTPPTVADISDAVWDEPIADHLSVGSTGKTLNDANSAVSPSDIADAVWAVSTSALTTPGTTGWMQRKLLTVAKFLGLK